MITLLILAAMATAQVADVTISVGPDAATAGFGRVIYAINGTREARTVRIAVEEIDVNGRTHHQETWIALPPSGELPLGTTRPMSSDRNIVSASYRVIESWPVSVGRRHISLGRIY